MPLDIPSWRQLGEANLAIGSLKEARYCFEELALLLDPSNLYYLLTLADICYAQESYRASRKYFSLAVTFDPYSPRALWGFVLAVSGFCECSLFAIAVSESWRVGETCRAII